MRAPFPTPRALCSPEATPGMLARGVGVLWPEGLRPRELRRPRAPAAAGRASVVQPPPCLARTRTPSKSRGPPRHSPLGQQAGFVLTQSGNLDAYLTQGEGHVSTKTEMG